MKAATMNTASTVLLLMQHFAAAASVITSPLQDSIQLGRSGDIWSQFTHAFEVKNSNLTPLLAQADDVDDIIIFEAYAVWCGFCQSIAPVYDGAAKHFNNVGGLVLSKGNCDNNGQLCNDLGVIGFPTFYYGTADDFTDIRANPLPDLEQLRSKSSAEEMINFLSGYFSLDSTVAPKDDSQNDRDRIPFDETTAPEFTLPVDAYLSDIEKSTSDSLTQALVSTHLIAKDGAREAFYDWQTWIADSHPSAMCRGCTRHIGWPR